MVQSFSDNLKHSTIYVYINSN